MSITIVRVQCCNNSLLGHSLLTSASKIHYSVASLPAGPRSAHCYSTKLDGTWYNLSLLEMSSVGLQLCAYQCSYKLELAML